MTGPGAGIYIRKADTVRDKYCARSGGGGGSEKTNQDGTAGDKPARRCRQGVAVSEMQEFLLNNSNVHDVERVDNKGEKRAASFASKKSKVR